MNRKYKHYVLTFRSSSPIGISFSWQIFVLHFFCSCSLFESLIALLSLNTFGLFSMRCGPKSHAFCTLSQLSTHFLQNRLLAASF